MLAHLTAVAGGGAAAASATDSTSRPQLPVITGGQRAASSVTKDASANRAYNAFATKNQLPTWEEVDATRFCDKEHVQAFAYFLVHEFVKFNTEDDNVAERTVYSYISGVMNMAKERFTDRADFFGVVGGKNAAVKGADNWYTKMNGGISAAIRRRAIENGDKIGGDVPDISRKVLYDVCAAYLEAGDIGAVERRFVLALLWSGCGRVGEVVLTNLSDLAEWDYTAGLLHLNWSQIKTSKQKGLLIVPAKDGHVLDFYHALGSYLAVGGVQKSLEDNNGDPTWLLPDWRKLTSASVCKKIANIFGDCRPSPPGSQGTYAAIAVPSVNERASGLSVRHGAVNWMKFFGCTFEQISFVSGHEMDGTSALWWYVMHTHLDTLPGAKALAGWSPTTAHTPVLPTFEPIIIGGVDATYVQRFVNEVLGVRVKVFYADGAMRPLAEACAASLVRYFSKTMSFYGESNVVNNAILAAGGRMRPPLTRETLIAWSKVLDADNTMANVVALDGTKEAMAVVATEQQKTGREILQLAEKVRELGDHVQHATDTVVGFEGMLRDLCKQTKVIFTSPRKKRANESADFEYSSSSKRPSSATAVPPPPPLPLPIFSSSSSSSSGLVPAAASNGMARLDGAGTNFEIAKLAKITIAQAKIMQAQAGVSCLTALYSGTNKGNISTLKQASDAIEKFVTTSEKAYLSNKDKRNSDSKWLNTVESIWNNAQFRLVNATVTLEIDKYGKGVNGGGKINGIRDRLVNLSSKGVEPALTDAVLRKYPCTIDPAPKPALQPLAQNVAANRHATVDASPSAPAPPTSSSSSYSSSSVISGGLAKWWCR